MRKELRVPSSLLLTAKPQAMLVDGKRLMKPCT